MVVYLDLAFLVNALADGLALYATSRQAGSPVRWRRLFIAAMLGGTYGMACLLPGLGGAAGFFPQMLVAGALVWLTFGGGQDFLRRALLFFILSCTMGGILMAAVRLLQDNDGWKLLQTLNWKVFFLVGIMCYILLSVVFRGGARHVVAGQLRRGWVERGGRRTEFTALLDTGHTLTDGAGGVPVLILEATAAKDLFTGEEWAVLKDLLILGPARCLERLAAISPGAFRLLPYRAVGVSAGLLLCFRADGFCLDGEVQGPVTVAVCPTPVSDGGGYTALWGGALKKGEEHHAA